jgi:hypothetical protein
MYFLGGMTPIAAGWVNPMVVYVDFVSQYDEGWLWQLYSNRTLIGATGIQSERRVYGQVVASDLPSPLTLVRVDHDNVLTDYGPFLPHPPWLPSNGYRMEWNSAGMSADTDHFDIIRSSAAGEAIDLTNVLGRVPFTGDGDYTFELPAFSENGTWAVGLVPRDGTFPLGNPGATVQESIIVATPPPDVVIQEDGSRFSVVIAGGILTANFVYPEQ